MNKKIWGILTILVVAAALAGYFILLPHLEKEQAARVTAFIDELPGDLKAEDIQVRLLDGTVEVLGLKGDTKYIDGSDMTVDVARIAVSGVTFTPGEGVDSLLDEAVFENVNLRISILMPSGEHISSGLVDSVVQNLTLKKMVVKGLRGDYASLRAAVKADSRADLFDCLVSTFSVAEISCTEYAAHVETPTPVSVSMRSMTAKNVSLLQGGPSTCEGMSVSLFGGEVLRLGSMKIASCSIPNIYPAMITARESGDFKVFNDKLFSGKEGEGITIEGMVMQDIYFKFLLPEPLTIDTLGMDFSLAQNRIVFKKDVKELVIPASMYRNLGMEVAQFANYYGQPIIVDAAVAADLRWEPGRADILFDRLFLEARGLGTASLSATLFVTGEGDTVEEFLDNNPEPYLVKADMMLEDKALLANIFGGEFEAIKAFGLTGEGMESSEDLRSQSVAALEAETANLENEAQKAIAEGLIKLLKAPGRLTVSLTPEVPVKIDEDDAALNAKVAYEAATEEEPFSPVIE